MASRGIMTAGATQGGPDVALTAAETLACPAAKRDRSRLRAMASDLVAPWRTTGVPGELRSATGLRQAAAAIVRRAGLDESAIGWTMVTIVSEYWRPRLGQISAGRKLLLLPDCPCGSQNGDDAGVPRVCGPSCSIATIWAAARDSGWTVESTSRAVTGIGSVLTGQCDGVLGVARLRDLEKAFAMLPAFSLPVAAIPCELPTTAGMSCTDTWSRASLDVDWVLGLLGVAGGEPVPVDDYLPLLREAAEMFSPSRLAELTAELGLDAALGDGGPLAHVEPLDATAAVGGDFLARGGKFLRPFVTLAAFDAVRREGAGDRSLAAAGYAAVEGVVRGAAKAAAVAIEVFHKASLIHDDIEDDDQVRYARPTLHVERGVPTAINVGDYLLGVGYRMIAALPGLDPGTLRDAVGCLADAHVRLARGQGAELWWRDAGQRPLSVPESLEIYALKTAPAFEAAIAIGLRVAGVVPQAAVAIGRYARHVGVGFQILNDLKDWGGDLENNRRAAGDLLGGRPTLMWALALERLPPAAIDTLRSLAAAARRPDASEADVVRALAEARRLYATADVVARAAAIVAEQRAAAMAAVATCRLPRLREVLEFLLDLAVPDQAAAGLVGG